MKAKLRAQPHSASSDVAAYMHGLGRAARDAAREIARAGSAAKNRALRAMAAQIRSRAAELLAANGADLAQARKDGHDGAFVDRLALDAARIEQMARGLE